MIRAQQLARIARHHWSGLGQRRRVGLATLMGAVFVIGVSLLGLVPSHRFLAQSRLYAAEQHALLTWLQENPPSKAAQPLPEGALAHHESTLLAAVNAAAQAHRLVFSNYRPEGESKLTLDLTDGDFDHLMRWIEEIDRTYGAHVERIEVRRASTRGKIDALITLYLSDT